MLTMMMRMISLLMMMNLMTNSALRCYTDLAASQVRHDGDAGELQEGVAGQLQGVWDIAPWLPQYLGN